MIYLCMCTEPQADPEMLWVLRTHLLLDLLPATLRAIQGILGVGEELKFKFLLENIQNS